MPTTPLRRAAEEGRGTGACARRASPKIRHAPSRRMQPAAKACSTYSSYALSCASRIISRTFAPGWNTSKVAIVSAIVSARLPSVGEVLLVIYHISCNCARLLLYQYCIFVVVVEQSTCTTSPQLARRAASSQPQRRRRSESLKEIDSASLSDGCTYHSTSCRDCL